MKDNITIKGEQGFEAYIVKVILAPKHEIWYFFHPKEKQAGVEYVDDERVASCDNYRGHWACEFYDDNYRSL